MMWMWFHTQIKDTVLFKWWTVNTVGTMLITCAILFLGAICFEALKWLRLVLEQQMSTNAASGQTAGRTANKPPMVNRRYTESLLSRAHLLQTLLFTVQLLLSYLLMLAFMTFSVWIGIAICAGAATGFWLFGKRLPVIGMAPTTTSSSSAAAAARTGYSSTAQLH